MNPTTTHDTSHLQPPRRGGRFRAWFGILITVIVPTVAVIAEGFFHIFGTMFFEITPSLLHSASILSIPIAAIATLRVMGKLHRSEQPNERQMIGLSLLQGCATAVSGVYTAVFGPILLLGVIIIPLGLGIVGLPFSLLLLSPALGLLGISCYRWRTIKLPEFSQRYFSRPFLAGILIGLLIIGIAEAPRTLTNRMLEERERTGHFYSPRKLRLFGDTATLISYVRGERVGEMRDFLSVFTTWCAAVTERVGNRAGFMRHSVITISKQTAEEGLFIATGKTSSEFPLGTPLEAFRTPDSHRGTTKVGEKIDGLTLATSELHTSVDPEAALTYSEWTMTFENTSFAPEEARAELQLPQGGVVSRATLWVNGVEQEAAVTAKNTAQRAYQRVVSGNRDPLLVTETSPGRVFVQCFPVPSTRSIPNATMKIRIGVTAPVPLNTLAEGAIILPSIIDANFSLSKPRAHTVKITSDGPVGSSGANLITEVADGEYTVHGAHPDPFSPVQIEMIRNPARISAWSDLIPRVANRVIVQQLVTKQRAQPDGVLLVVDGSAVMGEHLDIVKEVIDAVPLGTPLSIYLAGDSVEEPIPPFSPLSQELREVAKDEIQRHSYAGGTDNGAALLAAVEAVQERLPDSPQTTQLIVWVRAPQPFAFPSLDTLSFLYQQHPDLPPIVSLAVTTGRDAFPEDLSKRGAFVPVSDGLPLPVALHEITHGYLRGSPSIARNITVSDPARIPDGSAKTSDHLTRLWALGEARRMITSGDEDDAAQLAARHRLITAVSGGVVLESDADYQRNGIKPPSLGNGLSGLIPTTPEPDSTTLVVILTLVTCAAVVYRRTQGVCHG